MLYSIAKQRKGSDVDLTAVHAYPGEVAQRPLALSKQPNTKKRNKYKTFFFFAQKKTRKKATDEYERRSFESLSAAVCGGTVKDR